MNTAKFAIKRPIFITSLVLIIIILGAISYRNISLELFPDISFPSINVTTVYSGASPADVENLITKPLEDELGTLAGLKHINAKNTEGLSSITLEFNMDVDVDKTAQDVRDKVSQARNSLPSDLGDDPVVSKLDPDASAVVTLALMSDLPAPEIYDLAKEKIKPQLSRIKDVGSVVLIGGSRREIQVEFDLDRLNQYHISLPNIANQMTRSGSNVSIGKQEHGREETVFRSIGDFTTLFQIDNSLLSFSGDFGNSVTVGTLGRTRDGIKDVTSTGYVYYPEKMRSGNEKQPGKGSDRGTESCIYLQVIKQSGKNSVEVADAVKKKVAEINEAFKKEGSGSYLLTTLDQSVWIKTNVNETVSSIVVGIILAVMVVFLFLGNIRSTIITAIAIPNSLLGAVIAMNVMGYSFNLMTLMALSLVVGLLVDDAIVVRENIFRKLESGMDPHEAAERGTTEVMLAVIATTLAIISVFFPIGMLSGVIGKLFKQFGFTVIFAMVVSLFDALTVAPFLSAYFAGDAKKSGLKIVAWFEKLQESLDRIYEKIMRACLNRSLTVIAATFAILIGSVGLLGFVKSTFIPTGDRGEFRINVEMPGGTSLAGTRETIEKIEDELRKLPDIQYYTVAVGNSNGEITKGSIECFLKKDRSMDTEFLKQVVRQEIAKFAYANPSVSDIDNGPQEAPFMLIVSGNDLAAVEEGARLIYEKVKEIPDLIDIDSTMKPGKPEFRIVFDEHKMQSLGVTTTTAGTALRYAVNGIKVGLFRQNGYNYDIRARLKPEQRDVQKLFSKMKVPNSQGRLVSLDSVAKGEYTTGAAEIHKRDKVYIVKITANLPPTGALGTAMAKINEALAGEVKLPAGVTYGFSGQAENFSETGSSIVFALVLALLFIFFVLASLYESYVTPFTILIAVPPALTGALLFLFITGFMLDIFSMIGMVMLIGLVTKNSILLVDNAVHGVNQGLDRKDAILQAGMRRLRPILMTTFAMLAGMFPLAMGIGEAAKMRQSMGIAIMGGITISTLVTLIVVPAIFEYVDRFRVATEARILVRRRDARENSRVETDMLPVPVQPEKCDKPLRKSKHTKIEA
ncbi:MAG: efflux RND transporter permease subunit [Spirochaetes bacterium]|nr:MAG: efflux RND transporter permease subunit [Spirochaetota bacterium]